MKKLGTIFEANIFLMKNGNRTLEQTFIIFHINGCKMNKAPKYKKKYFLFHFSD